MKYPRLYVKRFDRFLGVYIGCYFGFSIRRWPAGVDWNGNPYPAYLSAVVWYPRGWKRLGYLYPSIRWF